METQQWNILKYRLPMPIYAHSSILCNDNKNLYIIGGSISDNNDTDSFNATNIFWNIKLVHNSLDWNVERLIWIAFYKSNNQVQMSQDSQLLLSYAHASLLSKLPKDIILLMLNFLRNENIFAIDEQASCNENWSY